MLKLSEAALCLCLLSAFQASVFLGSCSSANDIGKRLRALCFRFLHYFAQHISKVYLRFLPVCYSHLDSDFKHKIREKLDIVYC